MEDALLARHGVLRILKRSLPSPPLLEIPPLEQLKNAEQHWKQLFASPAWYLSVVPEMQQMMEDARHEPKAVQDAFKAALYDFFERELSEGNISLGRDTCSFDADRKEIDMVIIHHTSNPPGLSPTRLSAIELVRLYAPYFANPGSKGDRHLRGEPIHSGHVRDGNQVFWPYHWIVRRNGLAERLLDDNEIGWHAGHWDVNCRSIAIVLDNDYENGSPGERELRAIARIIADQYRDVSPQRVLGHREVTARTTCPSQVFLDSNGKGWKADLLSVLTKYKATAKDLLN